MRIVYILCISLSLVIAATGNSGAQGRDTPRTFQFADMDLRAALDSLMRWYPVSIVYLDKDVEGKNVYGSCSGCSFEEALNSVLEGTSLTWIRTGNQTILKAVPDVLSPPVATLYGTVTDSITGEGVPDATVIARPGSEGSEAAQRWCPTNQYGFYSLRNLPAGVFSVSVRAVGYQPVEVSLVVPPSGPAWKDVALKPEAITLEEVTVEAYRSAFASAGSYSRGIYIRSGPSDQNQYFLDGARIYNPTHFGGVLSSISDEAVNEVQRMVEGMPPSYGGRIGGILDLSMRDGATDRLSGSAGTGSLGSRLSLEGPLGGSSTSFLVSGRRAYPDALVPFVRADGTPSRLGSSEVTAKMSHRLSSSSRLLMSGYWGYDSYDNQVEGAGMKLNNNFGWGNGMLNLRWIGIASPSLFLQASAAYSRYAFTLDHAMTGDPFLSPGASLSSDYRIEDITLRAQAEHYYDQEHTVLGGVELIHHRMKGNLTTFSTQIAPMVQGGPPTWELSVYLQDQWRIFPGVMAELGARATNFTGDKGSLSAVDPRFALLVSPGGQTRLYGTVTSINQFIHPYRNSGVFLFYPSIFWYPSTDSVRPSTSLQMTLGFEKGLGNDVYLFSAEASYRITQNLHEFMADTVLGQTADLSNSIHLGTGKSYGIQLTLRKRTGSLTGSLGYMYAREENTFDELNGGQPFIPRFSHRHELQLDARVDGGGQWVIGALCVLALTQSWQSPQNGIQSASDNNAGVGMRGEAASLSLFDLSQSRFPGFQRLELSVVRRVAIWGAAGEISLRLLNAYGLLDPFDWSLHLRNDLRLKWTAEVKQLRLFPLYPALGISMGF